MVFHLIILKNRCSTKKLYFIVYLNYKCELFYVKYPIFMITKGFL